MSYVKLFLFLAIVGVAGCYIYQHVNLPKPPSPVSTTTSDSESGIPISTPSENAAASKPSEQVGAVMSATLPLLMTPMDEKSTVLQANFAAVEQTASVERLKPGRWQESWNLAGRLCEEMHRMMNERNAAVTSLSTDMASKEPASVVPRSPVEMKEREAKMGFFKRSVTQRWNSTLPARKNKIETIYRQLLAAEAKAES